MKVASYSLSLVNDFSGLFKDYIDGLQTPKVKSLSELIAYNEEHRDVELPPGRFFLPCAVGNTLLTVEAENPGQERLYESEQKAGRLSKEEYDSLDKQVTAACAEHGIDNVLSNLNVDVIIGPADSLIPNVTALARMCCSLTGLEYGKVDTLCRIPVRDVAAGLSGLEWQTFWTVSNRLGISRGLAT